MRLEPGRVLQRWNIGRVSPSDHHHDYPRLVLMPHKYSYERSVTASSLGAVLTPGYKFHYLFVDEGMSQEGK